MTRRIAVLLLLLIYWTANAQQTAISPQDQLKQYVAELQKNPSDDALRKKIIKLALTLNPPMPTDAVEHEGGAEYLFKNAKNPGDFGRAADEYEKALLLAPWVGQDYFNLGVCYAQAGNPAKAIWALEMYLKSEPGADDEKKARKLIGGQKIALSESNAQQAAKDAEAAREQQARDEERARLDAERRRIAELETRLERLGPKALEGVWILRGDRGSSIEGVRHFELLIRESEIIFVEVLERDSFLGRKGRSEGKTSYELAGHSLVARRRPPNWEFLGGVVNQTLDEIRLQWRDERDGVSVTSIYDRQP